MSVRAVLHSRCACCKKKKENNCPLNTIVWMFPRVRMKWGVLHMCTAVYCSVSDGSTQQSGQDVTKERKSSHTILKYRYSVKV